MLQCLCRNEKKNFKLKILSQYLWHQPVRTHSLSACLSSHCLSKSAKQFGTSHMYPKYSYNIYIMCTQTTHTAHTQYTCISLIIQTQVQHICHGHILAFTYHTETRMHILTHDTYHIYIPYYTHIQDTPHMHVHAYTYLTAHVYIRYVQHRHHVPVVKNVVTSLCSMLAGQYLFPQKSSHFFMININLIFGVILHPYLHPYTYFQEPRPQISVRAVVWISIP